MWKAGRTILSIDEGSDETRNDEPTTAKPTHQRPDDPCFIFRGGALPAILFAGSNKKPPRQEHPVAHCELPVYGPLDTHCGHSVTHCELPVYGHPVTHNSSPPTDRSTDACDGAGTNNVGARGGDDRYRLRTDPAPRSVR